MRTVLCFSLLIISALAGEKNASKKEKRNLEVLKPSFYGSFPSSGISVLNLGASGLKSGLVAETGFGYGSTISPAISYDSAGHFLSSGVFGQPSYTSGILTGGPVVDGVTAVTSSPALSGASFVTGAPSVVTAAQSVVTAAPPVVTAAPPVVGGVHSVVTGAPTFVSGAPHVIGSGPLISEGVSALPYGSGFVSADHAGFPVFGQSVVGNGLYHQYRTINQHVPVPVPHPVQVPVTKTVGVPVPQPYEVAKPYPVPVGVKVPVEVPKPYEVKVPTKVPVPVAVKVPVEIPRPYPVYKTKQVKVEIERPVYVKSPVPIKVPVPVPYHVEVPQPVKVSVPQQIILKDPKVVSHDVAAPGINTYNYNFGGLSGFSGLPGTFGSISDLNGIAVTPSSPVISSTIGSLTPDFSGLHEINGIHGIHGIQGISGLNQFPVSGSEFGSFGGLNGFPAFGSNIISSTPLPIGEIDNAEKESVSVEGRSEETSEIKEDGISSTTSAPVSVESSSVSGDDFSSAFTSGTFVNEDASVSSGVSETQDTAEDTVNIIEGSSGSSDSSTTESETE